MKIRLKFYIIMFTLILIPTSTFAQNVTDENKDKLILQLLDPFFEQALVKHFGSLYNISTQCEKLVDVKRDPDKPRVFTVKAKTMTFEGAHNPPHFTVSIEVSNKEDINNFKLINHNIEKTKLGTTCQNY